MIILGLIIILTRPKLATIKIQDKVSSKCTNQTSYNSNSQAAAYIKQSYKKSKGINLKNNTLTFRLNLRIGTRVIIATINFYVFFYALKLPELHSTDSENIELILKTNFND